MSNLILNSLEKYYGGRCVVNKVSLSVSSGKVTGLLGPNGAGKTTTFYMAVGIIRPDNGTVFINDTEITRQPLYIRARNGIGYLPQESSIFKTLSVRQNIMAVLELQPISRDEQNQRADKLLGELGILRLASQKAAVLSGGERRRLEIARVLATNPEFVLLDEPFAGVDPLAVSDIKNIIYLLTEKKIGVLISDHNVRETLNVCDDAYILNNGELIESGDPEKIASSPIAKRFYLGDEFKL
jgi:lipopolysaccharide export system ATP-binding protein